MKVYFKSLISIYILFLVGFCSLPKAFSDSQIKVTGVASIKAPDIPLADTSMPDIVLDSSLAGDVNVDVSTIDVPDGTKIRVKFKDEENQSAPEGIVKDGMVTIPVNLKTGNPKILYAETEAIPQTIIFAPQYIPGLVLWLKADALNLINNDLVGRWDDSSNNNNYITQSDTNNKPVFKTNIINGKPIVRFDGINDYLEALSTVIDLSQKLTAYFVVKLTSNPTSSQVIFGTQPSYSANGDGAYFTANQNINWSEPAYGVNAISPGSFRYYTVIVRATSTNNGTVSWRANGVESLSSLGARATSHTGNLRIGARVDNLRFLNGDIAEILIYSGEHTKEQVLKVESYLVNKYGL